MVIRKAPTTPEMAEAIAKADPRIVTRAGELRWPCCAEVSVPAPPWEDRALISLDGCIADAIQALWDAGIRTRGCCCGHQGQFGPPSVILAEGASYERARDVLAEDGRTWQILRWTMTLNRLGIVRGCGDGLDPDGRYKEWLR